MTRAVPNLALVKAKAKQKLGQPLDQNERHMLGILPKDVDDVATVAINEPSEIDWGQDNTARIDRRRSAVLARRAAGLPLDGNDLLVIDELGDPEDGTERVRSVESWESGPPDGMFDEGESQAKEPAAEAPYTILTPLEIWAPLPPIQYVIDGIIPKSSLALIVAYGSSLKTWLEFDGIIAVAEGGKWLETFQCAKGEARIVDYENGGYELRRRAQRTARARGHQGPVEGVSAVTMPAFFLNGIDLETHLTALAVGQTMVAIDTLAAGTVDVNENDAQFAAGLQVMKRVAEATGCAFVVLHHSRKQGPNGVGDEREAVRGSGAIFAAADVVLHLRRHGEDGAMLLTQTKARGGKAIAPHVIKVEDVESVDGTRVYGRPYDEEEEHVETDGKFDAAKGKVIALLAHDRDVRSASEVFRRVKGNRKAVLDAVKELLERGTIVQHEGALRLASEVIS